MLLVSAEDLLATTKGEALAPPAVPFLAAWARRGDLESTDDKDSDDVEEQDTPLIR